MLLTTILGFFGFIETSALCTCTILYSLICTLCSVDSPTATIASMIATAATITTAAITNSSSTASNPTFKRGGIVIKTNTMLSNQAEIQV